MMLCQALGIGGTSAQGDKHISFIETLTGMYSYTRTQTYINRLTPRDAYLRKRCV